MQLTPYLNFNGNCAAAFKFYAQVLGGRISFLQTHGESPMKDQVPPEWRDKVIHAQVEIGSNILMGSDAPPDRYTVPQGNYVSLSVPSVQEGERIFHALAENGKVGMPFGQTFWSPGFGMVVDRFGTPWMVNCLPAAV